MNNINGAELLDEVRVAIKKYCILPSAHAEVAVALWVATTHTLPAFDFAPRMVVRSAVKRSGKTRLMETVDPLVHNVLKTSNASAPYVFRSLGEDHPPTIIHDEADAVFGTKKSAESNEDLRGLYNAGFQRGQYVGRVVGPNHEPKQFPTFAMVALSGIGKMPDTIEDRAVVVKLRRRKADETVQPFRLRRDLPALKALGERLGEWGATLIEGLTDSVPEDLGVEDRAADTWEPLISMADMAGGHWPKLARAAAKAMASDAAEDDEGDSDGLLLLRDIKEVFVVEFMQSKDLCMLLRQLEESPWFDQDLSPSKLGQRLREFQIKTGFEDRAKARRGYLKVDFKDAFDRYLPTNPSAAAEPVRKAADQQERLDAFESADALYPSAPLKASQDTSRSDGVWTGADGCGQVDGQESTTAGDLGTGIAERLNREAGVWQISGEAIDVQ